MSERPQFIAGLFLTTVFGGVMLCTFVVDNDLSEEHIHGTWRHVLDDRNINIHGREYVKSHED
jgi:hypothetical protein